MLGGLYQRAFPIARRILPPFVRARLGQFVGKLEQALGALPRTAPSLADSPPLLPADSLQNGAILHVNNALAWGGVERQVVNTLLGLQEIGNREVGLLCLRLNEGGDYAFYRDALRDFRGEVRDMLPLERARAELQATFSPEELARAAAIFDWMPADVQERIWRLLAEFVALKPAAVHAWQDGLSIETAYAGKLAGVPVIVTSARNVAPIHFAYGRPYMHAAYRAIAACSNITMLANSEAGARDYAAWLGIDAQRFRILRNGVNASAVQPLAADAIAARRRSLGIPDGAPVVGSVFRFYDEKRPLLWVEAAALVAKRAPEAHFVIFGAGPLREAAQTCAKRHGFAERFHTPGAATDGASAISMFDVFMLTSRFEGTPNVVLEASLLGVPVVAMPAGGAAEAIEPGQTGWIEERQEGLADRVLALLGDEKLRAQSAVRGPAFVAERFGLERMLAETQSLYRLPGA